MVTQFRPRVSRAITLVVTCVALTTACSGSDGDPLPTVTVTANMTIAPSPSAPGTPEPTATPSQEPEPTPQAFAVQPTVTIASVDPGGSITVGGFVIGVAEDDKECLFTLVSSTGGVRVTATTVGLANQGTTACGSTTLTDPRLVRGPWNVTLTYTEQGVPVTSEPVILEIP